MLSEHQATLHTYLINYLLSYILASGVSRGTAVLMGSVHMSVMLSVAVM